MRKFNLKWAAAAGAALVALSTAFVAHAYEEPRFEVLATAPGFEIRKYAPYVVAEVTAAGEMDASRNEAFRLLFRYISGANRAKESVSMTVPVVSAAEPKAQKMEMTVPVTSEPAQAGGFVTHFVLPSKFTLETAPAPTDARVRLREVAAEVVAVRTYSGTMGVTNYNENLAQLNQSIAASAYRPAGAARAAVYDGPFTLWFARRNEVMVPVVQK